MKGIATTISDRGLKLQQAAPSGAQDHCVAWFDLAQSGPRRARFEILHRDAMVIAHNGFAIDGVRERVVSVVRDVEPWANNS